MTEYDKTEERRRHKNQSCKYYPEKNPIRNQKYHKVHFLNPNPTRN
jgi:hypothetical protein